MKKLFTLKMVLVCVRLHAHQVDLVRQMSLEVKVGCLGNQGVVMQRCRSIVSLLASMILTVSLRVGIPAIMQVAWEFVLSVHLRWFYCNS